MKHTEQQTFYVKPSLRYIDLTWSNAICGSQDTPGDDLPYYPGDDDTL